MRELVLYEPPQNKFLNVDFDCQNILVGIKLQTSFYILPCFGLHHPKCIKVAYEGYIIVFYEAIS